MKKVIIYFAILSFLVCSGKTFGQTKYDYSFQNFFFKAKVADNPIYNLSLDFITQSQYDNNAIINFKILYPLLEKIEIGSQIGVRSLAYNQNGLTNLALIAKYIFEIDNLSFAVGTYFEILTGSEKVYEDFSENSIFVSFHHQLNERITFNLVLNKTLNTGVSLNSTYNPELFQIIDNDDKTSFEFLYKLNPDLSLVLEAADNYYRISIKNRVLVSLGANYNWGVLGILRGALGFNLDNFDDKFFTLGLLF